MPSLVRYIIWRMKMPKYPDKSEQVITDAFHSLDHEYTSYECYKLGFIEYRKKLEQIETHLIEKYYNREDVSDTTFWEASKVIRDAMNRIASGFTCENKDHLFCTGVIKDHG